VWRTSTGSLDHRETLETLRKDAELVHASAAGHDRPCLHLEKVSAQRAGHETDKTMPGGSEAVIVQRSGRAMGADKPGQGLHDQICNSPLHGILALARREVIDAGGGQLLRLAAVFLALRALTDAGVQHATASAATRLQSSGWPLQQSSTRKAMTERMPSTSDR
jgi:hypothetical protein